MLKITGLDQLQRQLQEAQSALETLNGELGSVSFVPDNPESIEHAIQQMEAFIDERVGKYASNPIIAPLIDELKTSYRTSIIDKAAGARLEESE